MTAPPETFAQSFFLTDSTIPICLSMVGGKPYVALSTEIAMRLEEFQSMMEHMFATHVTLKATYSA